MQPPEDQMVAKNRNRCPKCESAQVVPIAYGEPTEETLQAAHRGEVALGGCVIMGDDPNRECRECRHRWTVAEDRAPSRRRPARRSVRS